MSTKTKPAEQVTEQLTKQMDQVVGLAKLGCVQAEKAMDFWTNQYLEATKESQKVAKEWVAATKSITDEAIKTYQAQLKEFAGLFSPAA